MWVSTRTCESLAVAQSSAGHGININTLPGGWWIPANGSVKRRWCTQTHIHMHHNMWRERADPWLRENMAFLSCNVNFIIFNLVIFWPTFSVYVHTVVQITIMKYHQPSPIIYHVNYNGIQKSVYLRQGPAVSFTRNCTRSDLGHLTLYNRLYHI